MDYANTMLKRAHYDSSEISKNSGIEEKKFQIPLNSYYNLARIIHTGERREEGVPALAHFRRMNTEFYSILKNEKFLDNIIDIMIIEGCNNTHDSGESILKEGYDVIVYLDWLKTWKEPHISRPVAESTTFFTNINNLEPLELLSLIHSYDKSMQFYMDITKILDINDNYDTMKRFVSTEKNKLRLIKAQTYLYYLKLARERVLNNPKSDMLQKERFDEMIFGAYNKIKYCIHGYNVEALSNTGLMAA